MKTIKEKCLACGEEVERKEARIKSMRAYGNPMRPFCDEVCRKRWRRKNGSGPWK